ncbi:josephin-2 isoform X1 [Sander lucioperca]|uniref:josephin-2 isoform X1 n=1 Tax=Sander lucioperca TaxID=283035 RepID=UPI00125D0AC4|nr:josephin-2 isoform X1 [Sander lucioperca]
MRSNDWSCARFMHSTTCSRSGCSPRRQPMTSANACSIVLLLSPCRLAPQCVVNPHRSVLGTGNYDVNVIMAALQSRELAAVWWDKRRTVQSLCMSKVQGFILNVPSRVSLGIVSLPLRRRHWLAVRQVNGQYYNLDSKLKSPVCIGGEAELRTFLSEQLSQDVAEMLLVVRRDVEEDGSWLNADNPKK